MSKDITENKPFQARLEPELHEMFQKVCKKNFQPTMSAQLRQWIISDYKKYFGE